MFQKTSFDIPAGITFLNCANMSPQLKAATDKGINALHKKQHPWVYQAADWFNEPEQLRAAAAKIFQTAADNVALVPSVSYGMAAAARNMQIAAGKSIVLLDREFPSNYYVWQQLAQSQQLHIKTVTRAVGENWTNAVLAAIDEQTGLVALPQCHWTDGALLHLDAISKKTHALGIPLVLDLSQSLGAYPINIDEIAPDFAVCAGYKWMLGPYGLGYLYVNPAWHEKGIPLEYSWLTRKGSEDFTQLVNYTEHYKPGAHRFDMGEYSQLNLAPIALAAVEQLNEWGVQPIHNYLSTLTNSIPALSKQLPFVQCEDIEYAGHMRGIIIPDAAYLQAIRKALPENNIHVSFRGNAIRIAPHVYNDQQDLNRLFECLGNIQLP
ncbi:MAG TPA: aminotransferase class V-fold PLP-dependent enzyme [Chitinophaga sp.]|uniref:aminotransferase class V-fold PLP-dependent enzyme n=1 Tax=Chitinophaga sp. TaxID=1869181 RepID=UPI002F92D5BE